MPTNRKKIKRYKKTKLTENLINFLLTGKYDLEANDGFEIFLLENNLPEQKRLLEDHKELLTELWFKSYGGEGKFYVERKLEKRI